MMRRLLTLAAFIGTVSGFWLLVRHFRDFADRFCGQIGNEAGGNCAVIADYYLAEDIAVFSVFAVTLLILILLPIRPWGAAQQRGNPSDR